MKTAISIGDRVIVANGKHCFYGVVKAKHLFSYDVFHLWEQYCEDYDEVQDGCCIKRYPRRKVFWSAKNELETLSSEN